MILLSIYQGENTLKLSKLYTNQDELFVPIIFNTNNKKENYLNIIYAEVLAPDNDKEDLHNLGKTILTEIIDFSLLKTIKQQHFLHKHFNRFKDFVFYIEIQLNSGKFLTICRGVSENTKISIKFHDKRNQNYTELDKDEWSHYKIAIDNAEEIINYHLALTVIQPWNYRQGLSYFLRTQNDYLDYFQISKFIKGKDSNWKPYIAKILGLDAKLVQEKYKIEKELETAETQKDILCKETEYDEEEFDKLNSIILLENDEIEKISQNLDKFNFSEQELRINKKLAKDIEFKISCLNEKLYNVNYDLEQIRYSLEQKIDFNLKSIKKVFDDANLYFPNDLLKDYESLIIFNKKITSDRKNNLQVRNDNLIKSKIIIEKEIEELGKERTQCFEILNGENSIKKYKALHNEFAKKKAKLINYRLQFEKLKKIKNLTSRINDLKSDKISYINKINNSLENQSELYKNIVKDFANMAKIVFDKPVVLNTTLNKEGNLEFNISFKDGTSVLSKDTSESRGTTYKKILCALFDLAILRQYHEDNFYHFVYHDGVFEGVESRKKDKLLGIIRESVENYNIQYILSIIETDLPRDKEDKKIYFDESEIILRLNDLGEQGRIFKMQGF